MKITLVGTQFEDAIPQATDLTNKIVTVNKHKRNQNRSKSLIHNIKKGEPQSRNEQTSKTTKNP